MNFMDPMGGASIFLVTVIALAGLVLLALVVFAPLMLYAIYGQIRHTNDLLRALYEKPVALGDGGGDQNPASRAAATVRPVSSVQFDPPRFLVRLLLVAILLPVAAAAQSPEQWRGLVLGQSTPADAIQVLGEPVKDGSCKLFLRQIEKWFSADIRKSLRCQVYKQVDGFDKASLFYHQDCLMVIELDFDDQIDPNGLHNIYSVQFAPYVGRLELSDRRNFERHAGQVYPIHYPIEYSLVAVAPESILRAHVQYVGIGSVLTKTARIPDSTARFPGKVGLLQLISRKMENRDGADLLK